VAVVAPEGQADNECRRPNLSDDRAVTQVALFSGGLDSTSGIATLRGAADHTQLVSHYSRQKTAQLEIAKALGFGPPTQARLARYGIGGRGRGFLYRSFYFFCLGGSVASSYGARRVFQFENGVLATAMPPSPTYFMTRHAHPLVHRRLEMIFSELFGGAWKIENPFLGMTKRDCVDQMRKAVGGKLGKELIAQTETCWYINSYQFRGNKRKDNGKPCGVCVPCIVRQTALRSTEGFFKLDEPKVRNDPVLAREFLAYVRLTDRIREVRATPTRLLFEMPSYVREIADGQEPLLTREQLLGLFDRFAQEFHSVFRQKD
jgi:7-cyano-7-deazaguanine synthase in queuosine biosynthesis